MDQQEKPNADLEIQSSSTPAVQPLTIIAVPTDILKSASSSEYASIESDRWSKGSPSPKARHH